VTRIDAQPGERIDRSRPLAFTFDGRDLSGLEGDTIGSALFAAGVRTFSRSFKYHRRRGLMCAAGQCPNCLVAVDGAPGVRACVEPLRDGMRVEHLNATPSLSFDVMRATDLVGGPFTPPGFYYKTFIRPRRLWPLYEHVLRTAAGLGRLRRHQDDREWATRHRRRHADVLVVGAGAAGLAAATAAASAGADVVLVDEGPEPGGRLLATGAHVHARERSAQARRAGVEILSGASALGYFDGMVPVWQGDMLHQIRASAHVFATGTIPQPLVFAGNDLPGVMLAEGALRLAALYGVAPGRRAVLVTVDDRGLEAAAALRRIGVEIVAVADLRPSGPGLDGVEVLQAHTIVQARGWGSVSGVVLAPLSGAGERRFACDLVLVSGGRVAAASLPLQAGARAVHDEATGGLELSGLPERVFVAGELAGTVGTQAIERSGTLAGMRAAGIEPVHEEPAHEEPAAGGTSTAVTAPPPVAGAGRGRCFACLCEDVTAKDIAHCVEEGYDSFELLKRYSTVTMGPCQGRMCQLASARLLALETGRTTAEVGLTTARPPWAAVPLGVLAGRPFEPAKRSPMHARHRELRANIRWAGDWRRPYDYGDPEAEALAVHERAGLIDVSTLGKLLVRGPQAGELLDMLYPNRVSDLRVGRVRYGVLTSEAGRIIDDGTICRLDEETFYVTTTSTGAGAVEQWFSWWLAAWGMRAQLIDLTQGLAAMNLAGPRSRELLQAHCELDCSPEAFRYLDGRVARVAGVECLILRIGFTGELGYEIHCSAAHGEHVWDALLAGGGVRPFGLEPQRVLRLQKQHIIVGQDTDSESNPYAAGMPWAVKLDKEEDFIGRWALEDAAQREPRERLVGFIVDGDVVPTEGAAVVDDGTPVGMVTSARRSRQLGCVIGMAWVPPSAARDGASVTISDAGRRTRARIVTEPFYDPAGAVVRS
jgi:sarcosine oxidase subunit alpha